MQFIYILKDLLHIHNETSHPKHKKLTNSILDDSNSKIWFYLNIVIILLILFSISLIIFESIWDNSIIFWKQLYIIDGFISVIFLIEYLYRLYYSISKIKFVIRFMNIIDLLAFLPFFLELIFTSFIDIAFLKALRILRVFRIFKLVRHFKSVWFILTWLKNYRAEYQVWAILVFIVLLLSSILMYNVEWHINESFNSVPKTIWWSIVTMTTVWYWDSYPITIFWKILWSFIILIWPMVIAMISSITVLVFFEVAEKNKLDKLVSDLKKCPRCYDEKNLVDSNYCRKCWENLKKEG